MKDENKSKSTKDLIIEAAFSFYDTPRFKSFSLSEVAAKVGVSKTAIYRHFENKEALFAAMEAHLLDSLAEHLSLIKPDNLVVSKVPFARLIDFFVENPFYINYFIGKQSSDPLYEERTFRYLKEKTKGLDYSSGFTVYENPEKLIADSKIYAKHIFCGITIFYFVKVQEKLLRAGLLGSVPEKYSEKVVDFMLRGLSGIAKSSDIFCLKMVEEERMLQLDEICSIKEDYLPEENRIFTALANVIKKHQLTGVTIEKIADELNMAKSSLYEYFANKNELIRNLIEREMNMLRTIVYENGCEAKNFTEYIYILMRTEFEYFTRRPSIIPICGWLLMTSDQEAEHHEDDEFDDHWIKRMPEFLDEENFGHSYSSKMLLGWIGCLPIGLLAESSKRNIEEKKNLESLKCLFRYIVNGIEV